MTSHEQVELFSDSFVYMDAILCRSPAKRRKETKRKKLFGMYFGQSWVGAVPLVVPTTPRTKSTCTGFQEIKIGGKYGQQK